MTYVVKFNCSTLAPYIFDLARVYHQSVITVSSTKNGIEVEFDYYRDFEKENFIKELEAVKSEIYFDSYAVRK